jgi:hypothetical protein
MTTESKTTANSNQLPEEGFVRLKQIIGNPDKDIPPIIPVCRTAWYNGVESGKFPKPIKMGTASLYRVEDIRALLVKIEKGGLA